MNEKYEIDNYTNEDIKNLGDFSLDVFNKTINLIIERINPSLEIEGLLLTMFDSRNNICKTVASEVRNFFKEKVLNTLIPKNVKLAECPSFGKCIFDYDQHCIGAISYLDLSKELILKNGGSFVEKISL